jgi:hypothetical protein
MSRWSSLSRLALLAGAAGVLCLPAAAQVTDDLFDVAQGSVVIACGGVNCENVIGAELGGVEAGNYFCPTGSGIGAICAIDFETPAPVEITGIRVYLKHDDVPGARRATDQLEFFADLNDDGDFDDPGEDLVFKSIAIPYADDPDNADAGLNGNELDLSYFFTLTAMRWRLQVRWPEGVTGAGGDGPRILEVDALSTAPPCLPNLSARTGLRASKDGAGGIDFRWDADPMAPLHHVNAVDGVAQLVPPGLHRAPVGGAIAACDATAPADGCTHVDAVGGPALLFYQVVSACGAGGLQEGPLD